MRKVETISEWIQGVIFSCQTPEQLQVAFILMEHYKLQFKSEPNFEENMLKIKAVFSLKKNAFEPTCSLV